jgi:hypothetical protein
MTIMTKGRCPPERPTPLTRKMGIRWISHIHRLVIIPSPRGSLETRGANAQVDTSLNMTRNIT